MPFDHLPGAKLDTSPLTRYQPYIAPARPVFPTYQVVMNALDKLLPAIDPLERAKKKLAMDSIPLERARMEAERNRMPLVEKETKLRLKMLEEQYDQLHNAGNWQKTHSSILEDTFGKTPPLDSAPQIILPTGAEAAPPIEATSPQLIPVSNNDPFAGSDLSGADIPY